MAYIYQADLWCDSCGKDIRDRILAGATEEERELWEDDNAFDSDEFPKRCKAGKSDSPSHCGAGCECLEAETLSDGTKIGALLSDSLTSDGIEYVKAAVAENDGNPAVLEFWREAFSWIDFPSEDDGDDEETEENEDE